MQVKSKINQSNFNGIKLSNPDFDNVRRLALSLKFNGYDCLGYKKVYCDNNISSKINRVHSIRSQAKFPFHKFGVVILPWSKEAYFLSSPYCEQSLYRVVKKYDKGAKINLSM